MDMAGDDRVPSAAGEGRQRGLAEDVPVAGARRLVVAVAADRRCARGQPVAGRLRQQTEGADRQAVAEDPPHDTIGAVGSAQGVAVGQQEAHPVHTESVGVADQPQPDGALQVPRPAAGPGPVVVVAAHERELDSAPIGALERIQDGAIAGRRRGAKVEPEIKDVAQQIERVAGRQAVEEGDQILSLGGLDGGWAASQMDVGEEIRAGHGVET